MNVLVRATTTRLCVNLSLLLRAGHQFTQSTLELRRKGPFHTVLSCLLILIR